MIVSSFKLRVDEGQAVAPAQFVEIVPYGPITEDEIEGVMFRDDVMTVSGSQEIVSFVGGLFQATNGAETLMTGLVRFHTGRHFHRFREEDLNPPDATTRGWRRSDIARPHRPVAGNAWREPVETVAYGTTGDFLRKRSDARAR